MVARSPVVTMVVNLYEVSRGHRSSWMTHRLPSSVPWPASLQAEGLHESPETSKLLERTVGIPCEISRYQKRIELVIVSLCMI